MKKILSIVLALTMLCAMLIPMTISASAASANTLIKSYADAKDGDKLIDLLFGQTSGAYQPHMFGNGEASVHDDACYNTANPHVDVTKDGSSFTIVNDDLDAEGDQCGNLQYGGKIDGLKAGKDANGNTYKYTYAFQARFQDANCDSKHSGFYFCLNSGVETYTDALGRTITNIPGREDGHTGAYGWWGHPYKSNGATDMRYHVILRDGSTIKNLTGNLSDEFKADMKAGAGDWYDIVIEIDGYKMNISFNGTWLGWYDFTDVAAAVNGDSTDLAFIARLFNEDMTLGVRNVSIYKGIGIEIPEEEAPKPAHPVLKLNVALWTNVGGVSEANKLNAEQVETIKSGFEKVLADAGYDVSKVKINWTDLCADGGHGVESLVPLTNDGNFDVVLGAGTNAMDKGLTAIKLAPMVVGNTKRQAVLIDENNVVAAALYEYVTTGKTTGYPAPPTGDNTTAIFFAIIAVVALGGTVVASKKRFN